MIMAKKEFIQKAFPSLYTLPDQSGATLGWSGYAENTKKNSRSTKPFSYLCLSVFICLLHDAVIFFLFLSCSSSFFRNFANLCDTSSRTLREPLFFYTLDLLLFCNKRCVIIRPYRFQRLQEKKKHNKHSAFFLFLICVYPCSSVVKFFCLLLNSLFYFKRKYFVYFIF